MANSLPKIGIIGYGFVGQAVAYGFSSAQIRIFDKYIEGFNSFEEVASQSEFIFICLPSPIKSDESGIDLSIIEDSIAKLVKFTNQTDKIVVIKSTVIPGTTLKLCQEYPETHFVFNPEFLTEANFLQDFVKADRTIIGALNDQTSLRVVELYRSIFPNMPIFQTDPTTAEMVKYMANCFLATKVTFANVMFDLCQSLGIQYDEVKRMVVADHRIYDSHLNITGERGFGGKCLPKDLLAIRALAREKGANMALLDTIWQLNLKTRHVRDWEEIPFVVSIVKTKKSSDI